MSWNWGQANNNNNNGSGEGANNHQNYIAKINQNNDNQKISSSNPYGFQEQEEISSPTKMAYKNSDEDFQRNSQSAQNSNYVSSNLYPSLKQQSSINTSNLDSQSSQKEQKNASANKSIWQKLGWGSSSKQQSNDVAMGFTQKFCNKAEISPQKQYMIVSALSSGLVLEICKQGLHKNKAILGQRGAYGNQKFCIKQINGKYQFVNRQTGYILQIPSSSTANKVSIFVNCPNYKAHEFWELVESKQKDNGYIIKSFCGKCMDVSQQKPEAGTLIIQYSSNGGRNQVWYLKQI